MCSSFYKWGYMLEIAGQLDQNRASPLSTWLPDGPANFRNWTINWTKLDQTFQAIDLSRENTSVRWSTCYFATGPFWNLLDTRRKSETKNVTFCR
jgi:hypothetical protein